MIDPALRIAELEAELRQRENKIKELSRDRDEAQELADRMRQQVEDAYELIDELTEDFNAETELWATRDAVLAENRKLITERNRFRAKIKPGERGRPINASTAQQADVLRRRKAGETLGAIARATSLSLRTVRTITDKSAGKGRAGKRREGLRRKEFDRQRAARFRVRKKAHDALPKRIAEVQKTGEALIKEAKGLGR